MDISVSRLNKRMALQLPAEFPLGLVFVVGKVRNLTNSDDEGGLPYFYLSENDHMLRCHLSERALEESNLNEGDMIRAGGHLAFDILQADYFLLARDIEVLPEHRPSRTTLAPILADIKKRSQAASLVPAELPDWVQQIAPIEFRPVEDSPEPQPDSDEATLTLPQVKESEPAQKLTAEPQPTPFQEGSSRTALSDEMIAFLSEAMDSPDDVELTHEMVAELSPAIKPERVQTQAEPIQSPTKKADPPPGNPLKSEPRIPWTVVLIVFFALLAFLSLILILALVAAT